MSSSMLKAASFPAPWLTIPGTSSRHFAELCSEVMVANGFKVYFLDGYRSTPELSFAVRHKQCSCGIMVTASHNPPSDNAVKAYWSTGGQLLPPHDQGVIDRVMAVQEICACRLPRRSTRDRSSTANRRSMPSI